LTPLRSLFVVLQKGVVGCAPPTLRIRVQIALWSFCDHEEHEGLNQITKSTKDAKSLFKRHFFVNFVSFLVRKSF